MILEFFLTLCRFKCNNFSVVTFHSSEQMKGGTRAKKIGAPGQAYWRCSWRAKEAGEGREEACHNPEQGAGQDWL
jgi:hypothetical protein